MKVPTAWFCTSVVLTYSFGGKNVCSVPRVDIRTPGSGRMCYYQCQPRRWGKIPINGMPTFLLLGRSPIKQTNKIREQGQVWNISQKLIPEGSAVMVPTWYIHHDPNTWPDPWKFDPERFSPENRYISMMTVVKFYSETGEILLIFTSKWTSSKDFLTSFKTVWLRAIRNWHIFTR